MVRYLLTCSQQESDAGVVDLVYPYHHLNFLGFPVEHKSNTPAAVSLWIALSAQKRGKELEEIELYNGVNRRHVVASQAGKHIDAVAYDGPQHLLNVFSGSALVARLAGYCRKVYKPQGNWLLEEPSPNEERPSCTDDEPHFLHGWNCAGPPVPCHSSQVANTTNINDDGRLHASAPSRRERPARISPLWQYQSADGDDNWPSPPKVYTSMHKHHANKPEHPDVVVETRVSSFKVVKRLESSLRAKIPANVANRARAAIFGNSTDRSTTSSDTAEQPGLQPTESQVEVAGSEESASSQNEAQSSVQSGSEEEETSSLESEADNQTGLPEDGQIEDEVQGSMEESAEEEESEESEESAEEEERPERYERPQSRIGHRDDGYNTPERAKSRLTVYDDDTSSPEPSPTPRYRSSVNGLRRSASHETLASTEEDSEEESEKLEGDDEDFCQHIDAELQKGKAEGEMTEEDVNEESSEEAEEGLEEVAEEMDEENVDQDSDQADIIHQDSYNKELVQEEQPSIDISILETSVQDVPCDSHTSNEDGESDDAYFYSSSSNEAATPLSISSSIDDASWVDEAVDNAEEQKRVMDDQVELTERYREVPSIDKILATLRQSYLPTIIITPPEDNFDKVEESSPTATGIESDYLPTITVTPPEDSIDELEQLSPRTAGIEPVTAFDDLLTEALKQIVGNDVLERMEPDIGSRTNTAPIPLHDGFIRATTRKTASAALSLPPHRLETSGKIQGSHLEYENLEDIPLKPSFNEFLFGTSTIAIGHKAMELGTSIYQKFLKW